MIGISRNRKSSPVAVMCTDNMIYAQEPGTTVKYYFCDWARDRDLRTWIKSEIWVRAGVPETAKDERRGTWKNMK
jgi:hypothetical protein